MMDLSTKIQYLKGVGPKIGAKLNKLGIETVADLLFYYPRDYNDYTQVTKIADLKIPNNTSYSSSSSGLTRGSINSSRSIGGFPIGSGMTESNETMEQSSNVTVRARIIGIANKRTNKRRFTITEAVVEDGTGSLKVVWFNQPFLAKMLKAGGEIILNGKVAYNFYSHDLVMESPNRANRPKIVPIYSETEGISSYFIARQILNIKNQIENISEYLPNKIIKSNNLLSIKDAILNIHQPEDSTILEKAKERIAFDELFLMALRAQLSKVEVESKIAAQIKIDEKLLKEFTKALPFELTDDQKKAAWQIIRDMAGPAYSVIAKPMNRLLNGDVGSGKTVVAAFAAYVTIKAGFRVAMMAPTEILTQQHFETCCEILSKHGISVGLITSSQVKIQNPNDKCQIKSKSQNPKSQKLEAQMADLVVGTHALLQDKVDLQNVGLVIVDEQHRFGVRQRAALLKSEILNPKSEINHNVQNSKSEKANKLKPNFPTPHFLSMTATPIPRTLYLALFADLDLSVIKTMPKGRKEIKTRVVDETNREKAYQFIRKQIEAGRQAFVICPLIEDKSISNFQLPISNEISNSKKSNQITLFEYDRKSVMAEYDKLSKRIFPDLRIGMLHGRMKSQEKEAVMGEFKANNLDILVSTSVVEVGVDVPNASIIIIEDAERFGLAQLHQFRGRVGRAEHYSYCFLFSTSQNSTALSRLRAMEKTADGFKLAELDLKNRGAGDIFGIMQSGDINLKIASLSDRVMIEKASMAAKEIAAEVNKHPALMDKVKEFEVGRHLE